MKGELDMSKKKSKWYLKEDRHRVFLYSEDAPLRHPTDPEQDLGYILNIMKPSKKKISDSATVSYL